MSRRLGLSYAQLRQWFDLTHLRVIALILQRMQKAVQAGAESISASEVCSVDPTLKSLLVEYSKDAEASSTTSIALQRFARDADILGKACVRLTDIVDDQYERLAAQECELTRLRSQSLQASHLAVVQQTETPPSLMALVLASWQQENLPVLSELFASALRADPKLADQLKMYVREQIQKVIPFISHSSNLNLDTEAHAATSSLNSLELAIKKLHQSQRISRHARPEDVAVLIDSVVRSTIAAISAQRQLVDAIFASSRRLKKEVQILESTKRARTTADAQKSALIARLLQLRKAGKIPAFATGRGRAAVDPDRWIEDNLKPFVSPHEEQYLYVLDVYRHLDMGLYNVLSNRRRAAYGGTKVGSEYRGGRRPRATTVQEVAVTH